MHVTIVLIITLCQVRKPCAYNSIPDSRSQPLANRFELLQTLSDNEVRHEVGCYGLPPVVTEKVSFKCNKNGNGQN